MRREPEPEMRGEEVVQRDAAHGEHARKIRRAREVVAEDLPAEPGDERQALAEGEELVLGGDRAAESRARGGIVAGRQPILLVEALVARSREEPRHLMPP